MKRQGNLWDRMTSFENLLRAGHAAARGKRFKPGVARFVFDLERQLLRLHDELAAKTYRPGPYRTLRAWFKSHGAGVTLFSMYARAAPAANAVGTMLSGQVSKGFTPPSVTLA